MADITQRLGFDVSQGVTALRELTTAVDGLNLSLRNLNNINLGNVKRQLDSLNVGLGGVPNKAKSASTAMQEIGGATGGIASANQQLNVLNSTFQTTQQQATSAGRSIAGGFLSGFAILGIALSGLRDIRDLLGEAAEASREFGQAVAEVQTIAGPSSGFGELRDSLREISREFGRPTVEQAEAAYQAFSNQVIQTTEDMGFLADANRLAIATVSETNDAVNILSSVINSYGLAAEDATRISDVLFKGVEEGRFRLSEIANSFGTVSSLARDAGVSFEEITAGLATITKTGTTAAVAMTQLRGIVAKLLKPTELMKEAFAEFGATDGPSAIKAAGGLSELLQKMEKFAKQNGTTLVEMFGRIRGGAGALALVAENGEEFNRILDELEKRSEGAAFDAFEKINQTDARQAEIAFNELKVTIEELGDAIVPVITNFVQGINKIIPDAQTLGIILTGLTATLGLAAIAALKMVAAFLPMATIVGVLTPFAPLIIAVAAATGLAILAAREFNAEIQRNIDLQTEQTKAAAQAAQEQVKITKEKVDTLKQVEKDLTTQVEQEFGDQLNATREHNSKVIQEFSQAADQFVKIREASVKELEKLAKRAEKISDDADKRVVDSQSKLDDIKFDKSIKGFDDVRKGARQLQRATETAAQARRELSQAGLDEEKIRAALETRRRAEEQFAAAERTAAAAENFTLERKVADARERFLKDQIAQDKRIGRETGGISESAAVKAAREVAEQTRFIKGELELIKQLGNPFDQNGLPKSTSQMAADMKEVESAMEEVRRQAQLDPTGGIADATGIGDLLSPAGKEIVGAAVDFTQRSQQIRDSLQNVIDSAPFQARLQFTQARREAEAELKIDVSDAEIAGLRAKLDRQLATQSLTVPINPDLGAFEQGAQIVAGTILGLVTDINIATDVTGAFAQRMQEVTQNVRGLDQTGVDNAKTAVKNAQDILNSLQQSDQISKQEVISAQQQIDAASQILATQEEILKKQGDAAKAATESVPTKVNEGTTAVNNLGNAAGATAGKVQEIGTAAQTGANQLSSASGTAIDRLKAVENQAKQTAQAVQLALSGGGGEAVPAFFGRVIRRQTGGLTRGQDRILTSTAPGEFVVNAAATRRFYSELTAINARQRPQFRETGGAVTNVGDINVNIQTQDASDISGRNFARDLKRELRTRTSTL